ncbi:MAG: putative lipid II flippase FtsW [Proteobacteria bacterium]|jgi:cell division protein FtsW|nr:putative lipid II flippase FtsW [Pseudomonadota bacterium]
MLKHLSSPLLLAVLALMGVGVVQVYSSSYIFATESFGNGLFFFERQLLFALLAFTVLMVAAQIPIQWIEKYGWGLWLIAGLGVALTLVPGLGVRVGGAVRWLDLPFGQRFEPSELLKLSFSLLFASLLVRQENFLGRLKWPAVMVLVFAPMVLLLRQPDFGSFAIITAVAVSLLFAFGLKWRYITTAFLVMIPTFYYLVMMKPYRKARVIAYLDPWANPETKGFQVIQSMLSFSSGGPTGVGLGQGQGKLFFLPEAHTDFTMAVLGEELGFMGVLMVLALYGFIVLRGFQIALRCEKPFRKALALGISVTFALSVFINAGVVMGLLPTKGLTLPFLSYGGSSLVTLCLMFGILLNIEKSISRQEQNPFLRKTPSL